MRIARLAPLSRPVPPLDYGGVQRNIARISIYQAYCGGHDIDLYASADSTIIAYAQEQFNQLGVTSHISEDGKRIEVLDAAGNPHGSIRLVSCGEKHFPDYSEVPEDVAKYKAMNDAQMRLFAENQRTNPYEIIHLHRPQYLEDIAKEDPVWLKHCVVHAHNPYPGVRIGTVPLIAISQHEAEVMRGQGLNVGGVAHHGMDSFTHHLQEGHADYLAMVGRFADFKGFHRAIEIAKRSNTPLVIAGTYRSEKSREYFEQQVKPHLTVEDHGLLEKFDGKSPQEIDAMLRELPGKPPIIFVGTVNDEQKQKLYGNALATLFPISWAEPFGMVMIESMACGTPVIANTHIGLTIDGKQKAVHCGSPEEVLSDASGVRINAKDEEDSINQAVDAIRSGRVAGMDRAAIRQEFEDRFSMQSTVRNIDAVYANILRQCKTPDYKPELSAKTYQPETHANQRL